MNYHKKYLKYKHKYLALKKQIKQKSGSSCLVCVNNRKSEIRNLISPLRNEIRNLLMMTPLSLDKKDDKVARSLNKATRQQNKAAIIGNIKKISKNIADFIEMGQCGEGGRSACLGDPRILELFDKENAKDDNQIYHSYQKGFLRLFLEWLNCKGGCPGDELFVSSVVDAMEIDTPSKQLDIRDV